MEHCPNCLPTTEEAILFFDVMDIKNNPQERACYMKRYRDQILDYIDFSFFHDKKEEMLELFKDTIYVLEDEYNDCVHYDGMITMVNFVEYTKMKEFYDKYHRLKN